MRHDVADSIQETLGAAVTVSTPVGGGCIHDARRVDLADGRRVFVKMSAGPHAAMLEAEERSLRLLAPHIRVPGVAAGGISRHGVRWLALEWLDLRGIGGSARLGRALANLHALRADAHGLDHDNFIGSTPQQNGPLDEWRAFFIERRLRPQLALARQDGHALPETRILGTAEKLLEHHHPPPSLLHGDLWSGNVAALPDGAPVVFDPAAYFGDPEADLAMLELFGPPLGPEFFEAYGPEPAERARRRPLHDLYHALNHLHLFGAGYLGMVRRCLDELR